jgi:hypothetical protein
MLVVDLTDNAGPRRSGQWKKGQSGNPAGMPKGTRHRATQLAEKLMEDDAEDIVQAVISSAKAGDPTAMRLCIERLVPVRKGRPVTFDLPDIEAASDITKALGVIAKSMAVGELTPDYLKAFLDHLVNWEYVAEMYRAAAKSRSTRRPA